MSQLFTTCISQDQAKTTIKTAACVRLVQLVRSLTANQKVPGSIPGLIEGLTLGGLPLPHRP